MQPTLFIVDDDEAVRESLQLLLESAGHRVQSFASGSEFLTAMPSSEDGCLIIDVRMPGIGGLDGQGLRTRLTALLEVKAAAISPSEQSLHRPRQRRHAIPG